MASAKVDKIWEQSWIPNAPVIGYPILALWWWWKARPADALADRDLGTEPRNGPIWTIGHGRFQQRRDQAQGRTRGMPLGPSSTNAEKSGSAAWVAVVAIRPSKK